MESNCHVCLGKWRFELGWLPTGNLTNQIEAFLDPFSRLRQEPASSPLLFTFQNVP